MSLSIQIIKVQVFKCTAIKFDLNDWIYIRYSIRFSIRFYNKQIIWINYYFMIYVIVNFKAHLCTGLLFFICFLFLAIVSITSQLFIVLIHLPFFIFSLSFSSRTTINWNKRIICKWKEKTKEKFVKKWKYIRFYKELIHSSKNLICSDIFNK